MGRFLLTITTMGVSFFLLANFAFAGNCGKCQDHKSSKCEKTTDCGSCEQKCESTCNTGCVSKIDVLNGSGSLQDLLPKKNCKSLIDAECCPQEKYDLLRCVSWEGYTLCCTQEDFKLLCGKCPKKCDKSCKPKKPKCRQSTCSSC